jgi:hypothetical protein
MEISQNIPQIRRLQGHSQVGRSSLIDHLGDFQSTFSQMINIDYNLIVLLARMV